MNQRRAGLRDYVCARSLARALRRFAKHYARTVALHRTHLHLCRVRRHDNVCRDSAKFRRARERSSMIARRMRGHTAPRRRIVERKNGVGRPARLERAIFLKIFALKK